MIALYGDIDMEARGVGGTVSDVLPEIFPYSAVMVVTPDANTVA